MALPLKQLANFERIHLKPGETRTVKFELPHSERALRFWDESVRAFKPVEGAVELMLGSSSADIRLKATVQMS
jgi:beta-glucosidase